jgi:hypothetical protein
MIARVICTFFLLVSAAWADSNPETVEVSLDEAPPEAVDDLVQIRSTRPTVLDKDRWHLHLAAGTDFPIDIGGKFTVETPFRLRLHVGLGGMPRAFQDLAHSVAIAAGAYDEEIADAVGTTLKSAFVFHTGIGLRPAKRKGFVFDVGYRMLRFGSRNRPEDIVAALPGVTIPEAWQDVAASEVRMTSHLHTVAVRMGWEWITAKHLLIRLDVGGSFTVASNHQLSVPRDVEVPVNADRNVQIGEEWLDERLRQYAHTPTLGFSMGYAF